MKKISILFVAAFAVALLMPKTSSASSPDQRLRFGLNVNVALPMGSLGTFSTYDNFALYSENNNQGEVAQEGGFRFGFGLDFKAIYQLTEGGLNAYAKVGFLVNSLGQEACDSITATLRNNLGSIIASTKADFPMLLTVPLLVGAHYDLNFSSSFGLFAEAGLGVAFRSLTTNKVQFYDIAVPVVYHGQYLSSIECSNRSRIAASFAFEVGAGFNLNSWLSAGVFYSYMGAAKVKYKEIDKYQFEDGNYESETYENTGGRLNNQQITIRLGFTF